MSRRCVRGNWSLVVKTLNESLTRACALALTPRPVLGCLVLLFGQQPFVTLSVHLFHGVVFEVRQVIFS